MIGLESSNDSLFKDTPDEKVRWLLVVVTRLVDIDVLRVMCHEFHYVSYFLHPLNEVFCPWVKIEL